MLSLRSDAWRKKATSNRTTRQGKYWTNRDVEHCELSVRLHEFCLNDLATPRKNVGSRGKPTAPQLFKEGSFDLAYLLTPQVSDAVLACL
jgi:hypothetical protein